MALIQTNIVKEKIKRCFPEIKVEVVGFSTKGDRQLDRSLASFGGKGVFTKELEEALLSKEIDLAVHSAKDMPMEFPKGLGIGAVLDREDVRDVIVTTTGCPLGKLPEGSILGTSSLRRELQAKSIHPKLQVKVLRGNVQTRLQKLKDGQYDAIVLAAAGLKRLGLDRADGFYYEYMEPESFLPAAGQGILAVESRIGDLEEVLSVLNCKETEQVFLAERAYLSAISGGCNAPAAIYTKCLEEDLEIKAMYAKDVEHPKYAEIRGKKQEARELGKQLGEVLKEQISQKKRMGTVTLVGAGPGDAGLITKKGLEALKQADVVIYDSLISVSFLNETKEEAKLIYAGKRSNHHHLKQEETNDLLIKYALEGKQVVRLKGGDPFIFGRGGEEALELRKKGISYTIIPGVSSAYSVPAYAGIPVTHRTMASSVHILTGHESKEKRGNSVFDYEVLAKEEGTLVFLMGYANLGKIARELIRYGKNQKTPTAVLQQGTTAKQRVVYAPLDAIEETCKKAKIKTPAIVVIGKVTKLGKELSWFEQGALFGKKIMATGTKQLTNHIAEAVSKYGAEPVSFSLIETKKREIKVPDFSAYQWIVFTSANGVRYFFEFLKEENIDLRTIMNMKFAVIGSGTKRELWNHGFSCDYMPESFESQFLAKGLSEVMETGEKAILFRAKKASKELTKGLDQCGIEYEDVALYETIVEERKKEELLRQLSQIDYITFGSSSAVHAFFDMTKEYEGTLPKIISIGPITTRTLEQRGYAVAQTAKVYTVEGMCEAILEEERRSQ